MSVTRSAIGIAIIWPNVATKCRADLNNRPLRPDGAPAADRDSRSQRLHHRENSRANVPLVEMNGVHHLWHTVAYWPQAQKCPRETRRRQPRNWNQPNCRIPTVLEPCWRLASSTNRPARGIIDCGQVRSTLEGPRPYASDHAGGNRHGHHGRDDVGGRSVLATCLGVPFDEPRPAVSNVDSTARTASCPMSGPGSPSAESSSDRPLPRWVIRVRWMSMRPQSGMIYDEIVGSSCPNSTMQEPEMRRNHMFNKISGTHPTRTVIRCWKVSDALRPSGTFSPTDRMASAGRNRNGCCGASTSWKLPLPCPLQPWHVCVCVCV